MCDPWSRQFIQRASLPFCLSLGQVAIAGYSDMGDFTVESGKELLDILAEDSVEADNFRRFILRQSTTYFGESDSWSETFISAGFIDTGALTTQNQIVATIGISLSPFLRVNCRHWKIE